MYLCWSQNVNSWKGQQQQHQKDQQYNLVFLFLQSFYLQVLSACLYQIIRAMSTLK